MRIQSTVQTIAGTALLLCLASSRAAANENCLYQLAAPEASYTVLGSPVTPQSNYLVVDDCSKTAETVRHDLLVETEEHGPSPEQVTDLQRHVRAAGDELTRRRDAAARKREQEENSVQGFFSWLW